MINHRPKLNDDKYKGHIGSWWHDMYTEKEKNQLQTHFSEIIDILLGKTANNIDSAGQQFTAPDDREKLVGLSIQEGISLVESLGFKAKVKIIPKPKPRVPGQGMYDLVGGSFSCQSEFVGTITLCIKEDESTICRVEYGH